MTREDPQMKLRLPLELKEALTLAARENNRSINAEMVKRLEESIGPAALQGRATEIDDRTLDLFAEKVSKVLDEREKKWKTV
jgi:hypothetical protein